jgi:DNA helicase II / ATP-dependent DNA helicase PcrA
MGLSEEQTKAVSSTNQHNLILALPGAGKTFTMINYIENLVASPKNRILALTFTKAAAEEMKIRIGKKVFGDHRKKIHVSTFHSLILQQTRKHPEFSGRKLLSGNAADRVTNHIIESYRADRTIPEHVEILETQTHDKNGKEYSEPKEKTREISFRAVCKKLLKEYLSTPYHDEIEFEFDSVFKRGIDDFYEYYLDHLAHLKYWPMDVMCVEITKALMVGDITPINCSHLIVDEFQDTDPVQYAWVKSHGIAGAKITVVGDDDQAIYSFRGSMGVEGMKLFPCTPNAQSGTNKLAEMLQYRLAMAYLFHKK